MGTTRRKLYGKSRRQHGGGICKWVLIGALATLSGAHADDIGFRGRVSAWWNNPKPWDTGPSVELANYIVERKWVPSLNIYPDSCVIPPGIPKEADATKVVEPYLSPRMGTIENPPPQMGFLRGEVKIIGEEKEAGEPEKWIVEKTIDRDPEQYAIEKQFVTMKGGRKRQRKTLRRK
jgi:hypothetical protein